MGDEFCNFDEILGVDGRAVHDGIALSSSEQSNLVLQLPESSNSAASFEFDNGVGFTSLEQSSGLYDFAGLEQSSGLYDFSGLEQSSDLYNFAPFYNVSSPVDFLDDHESYPVLSYINQILMEENVEEQQRVHHDSLALQAAEESFYEILGKNYPTPLNNEQTPDGSAESAFQCGVSGNDTNSPANSDLYADKLSGKEPQPLADHFMSSSQANSLQSVNISKHSCIGGDWEIGSFTNEALISSFFSNSEAILQFKKGLEEGNKFLPAGSHLGIDLEKWELPSKLEKVEAVASGNKDEKETLVHRSRGRKHQLLDDNEADLGRSNKQSAVNEEEVELAEIFDALMLYADGQIQCSKANVGEPSSSSDIFCQNEFVHGSDVGKCSEARQNTDCDAPDISASLISCAQCVATGDQNAANEQLKLIRQHASRTGNPHQRLAVIFANALEARMTGIGADFYVALTSSISAAEELKSHRIYLCAPFRQMISFFGNKMILQAASKATTLHIVDFGISFGFQWPNLIQLLSQRAGGPPRLRITGIDYPQPGFRPAERIEQTGRRLAKYCERFNVPFQFQAIASKNWEKIEIDQIKVSSNEVLAVKCHYHFHGMPDETVDDERPRDAVFSLIRKMNPDILVTAILNVQLGVPYFLTRFREALLFYSMIFDLLDNNLPRNDQQRLKLEQDYFGPEVMNVVACEGTARICRPETYKQWQIRYRRAGFKCLPLNQDLVEELAGKVKEGYHKDFMFDGDGYWMHIGWKGKIITCCSCWVPA